MYRVVELGEGWTGQLIRDQNTFIGLESTLVIVAVLSLNAFHPGYCFREGYEKPVPRNVKGSLWKKRGESSAEVETDSPVTDKALERGSGEDVGSQDPRDKETSNIIAADG